MIRFVILILLVYSQNVLAQGSYGEWKQKFEQLGTMLPTPNTYRTASGAPGIDYWQQRADYKIDVTIDDETQMLYGEEEITYYNNSPDVLRYLWVQLDQNMRANNSNTPLVTPSKMSNTYSGKSLQRLTNSYTNSKGEKYNGGYEISYVKDKEDKNLNYSIVSTMMRIDLEKPMPTGDSYTFKIKWSFEINDRMKIGGRGGYEYFPKDKNYSYTIAQWFPRMAVYDDKEGWQNKQFLGRGEFALAFGDYELNVTVPADFIVAATGDLQNPQQVLTKKELERYERAKKTFDKPVLITTQDEAIKKENNPIKNKTKTWRYKAEMVRDVAFAASRKFIWDAMAVQLDNYTPLAMSYYSKEGNPLWEEESTKAVANTLKTYSEHTIEYPYPVAISVHAASIGMEYPMICFNFGRPNEDGTYSDATKWRMISVIIHEVGHFFIPMIINSDERQWTWMDEGLNTFIQSLTQKEYYKDMPLRRGTAESMVDYMRSPKDMLRPIMTNSEQIAGREFGANAYGKPASALSVLRETIMGPELFDYAFKEYSRRWAFKHPDPADFFRTMEDASAIDLDWFWRGWFYTTDNVDVSVEGVKWFKMKNVDKPFENKAKVENKEIKGRKNQSDDPKYAMPFEPSEFYFSETNKNEYREFMNEVDDDKIKLQNSNKNFYEVTFKNIGGLVTPLIIEWTYEDGSIEIEKLPAEIWRFNETEVSKVFAKDKVVKNIKLDPNKETADVNISDNNFPRLEIKSDFEKFRN
ncbi:MAG: aminopeptidase [Rhodothermaeota bacterium MED-G18]|nr:MAG: aminopeptidase [Rhodothermaeota bacterium MED-G18]